MGQRELFRVSMVLEGKYSLTQHHLDEDWSCSRYLD